MIEEAKLLRRVIVFHTAKGEVRYTLTNQDFLDLARAVEYEGPPKLGVAWTLLQRFGYLYPLYPTVSDFVKAYAQPISPTWFPTGKAHIAYIKALQANNDLKAIIKENDEAKKRAIRATIGLSKISSDTLKVLDTLFASHTSPIPKSLHYHAPSTTKTQEEFAAARKLDVVPYGTGKRINWFFGENGRAVNMVALLEDMASGSTLLALGYLYSILILVRRLVT